MNQLKVFETLQEFNSAKSSLPVNYVCFVREDNSVHYYSSFNDMSKYTLWYYGFSDIEISEDIIGTLTRDQYINADKSYIGGMQTVKIGTDVTAIGDNAFFAGYGSNNPRQSLIRSVIIPNSVTSIGQSAFKYTSITEIDIPDSVISIGKSAFSNCTELTSIKFPNNLIEIPDYCCGYDYKLSSIEIPNGVTSIGKNAFYGAPISEINLPDSVTFIDSLAFGSTNITSLVIPANVKVLNTIGISNLENITLPDGLQTLNSGAFYECKKITSIDIPESVTKIMSSVFCKCSSLKEVRLPSAVTILYSDLFNYDTNLESVYLPAGISGIQEYVFGDTPSLTRIYYPDTCAKWTSITKAPNWNYNIGENACIYCTDGYIQASTGEEFPND